MTVVPRWVAVMLIVVGAVVGAGCGDDRDGDVASFCDAVGALEGNDPFAELAIASPDEMRAAFDELADGVDRIAASAPGDARVQARAYREAVGELVDQLRGAGFDPREVDPLAYRRATREYVSAAVSVENAADALCS